MLRFKGALQKKDNNFMKRESDKVARTTSPDRAWPSKEQIMDALAVKTRRVRLGKPLGNLVNSWRAQNPVLFHGA